MSSIVLMKQWKVLVRKIQRSYQSIHNLANFKRGPKSVLTLLLSKSEKDNTCPHYTLHLVSITSGRGLSTFDESFARFLCLVRAGRYICSATWTPSLKPPKRNEICTWLWDERSKTRLLLLTVRNWCCRWDSFIDAFSGLMELVAWSPCVRWIIRDALKFSLWCPFTISRRLLCWK